MNETTTPQIQPQSIFKNLISMIDRPTEAFANLIAYPRWQWLLPLLLIYSIIITTAWVTAPYSSEVARKSSEQQLIQSGISAEEMEEVMAQTEQFTSPTFLGIVSSITGPLFITLAWVVGAAIIYFLALVAGADFNYSTVFIVLAWSNLPNILGGLVQVILIFITGKFPVYTGLAALAVTGDATKDGLNPLITLLSYADIFWIWHIVLLIIGLAVATKFTRMKAFGIVAVYILANIGLNIIPVLLGAYFSA